MASIEADKADNVGKGECIVFSTRFAIRLCAYCASLLFIVPIIVQNKKSRLEKEISSHSSGPAKEKEQEGSSSMGARAARAAAQIGRAHV